MKIKISDLKEIIREELGRASLLREIDDVDYNCNLGRDESDPSACTGGPDGMPCLTCASFEDAGEPDPRKWGEEDGRRFPVDSEFNEPTYGGIDQRRAGVHPRSTGIGPISGRRGGARVGKDARADAPRRWKGPR